ncbi:DUF2796 domain-containing protein [Stutzerimonas kirkiae]|uniref:DUF2796 domain-containing protein n=1 Tax=Stutzerimonas kirkiae TaxID=2211392 RepID=UPI0010385CA7|nr:DUF2796 domain-containing protein [Stutzerimonas kirkiae]TBV11496.1 DUF2796 domain-containing protein [Stutzerimonas kirkiae]
MNPLAFVLALLPLTLAHAHDHDHDHDSLGTHEHGVATLDIALEGERLDIALNSPAINLIGFEHQPGNDSERATLAQARQQLLAPDRLFALPQQAGCTLTTQRLHSPLFHDHDHDHDAHAKGHAHNDIEASYSFQCQAPDTLRTLDLDVFFKTFPGTEKIIVQLTGPSGQQGLETIPGRSRLSF